MKKYRKPIAKTIKLEGEQLLAGSDPTSNDVLGDRKKGWFSKQAGIVTDDEYLSNDISYNKGIFRSAEENSDDATIVNHY